RAGPLRGRADPSGAIRCCRPNLRLMKADLTSLRLFLLVAEELNIARAAARANIAASAISKRIQELEIGFATPLLVRHNKGVALTSAGAALYAHARSALQMQERISAEMSGFARGVRGHVRVSANPSAILQFLPEALARFMADFPDISVTLHEATTPRTIRMIEDGLVDFGIVGTGADHPAMRYAEFRRDSLALALPLGHPLSGSGEPILYRDTLEYDQVGLEEGSSIQALLAEAAAAAGKSVRLKIRVASFDGGLAMVEAGIGPAVLPASCIRPEHSGRRVASRPLGDSWSRRTLRLVEGSSHGLSAAARLLFDRLRPTPDLS
ncbi:MAG: LysR substrate-binding domain-containing protein, partial [Beijerinckiaceae bacterium]